MNTMLNVVSTLWTHIYYILTDWLASDEIAVITFYELKNCFNLIYLINKEVDSLKKNKHILCYFKKELFNLITSNL